MKYDLKRTDNDIKIFRVIKNEVLRSAGLSDNTECLGIQNSC